MPVTLVVNDFVLKLRLVCCCAKLAKTPAYQLNCCWPLHWVRAWHGQLLQAQHRRCVTPSAEVIWLGFVEGARFWLRAAALFVVGVFVLGVPQTLGLGSFFRAL